MSVRRVRIYSGSSEERDVLGFSHGALRAPDDSRFAEFMRTRGYSYREAARYPSESVSIRHIEVRPSLSEEHIKELGILCVGGELDGTFNFGIVDGYHDGVAVLDNRNVPPKQPLGEGIVVARGD